MTSKIIGTNDH
jgi:hypothetical protein